jgi:hypothetical protein
MSVITMEQLDLSGGHSFAVGFPETVSMGIALACGFLALVSLLASWLFNKQPIFSMPHAVALLFLAPLAFALPFHWLS